ncbi:hypothetical protein CEXT_774371 [Caerostris extrusa]|uniref:Uncharacterized protein n=1 Tax=Caerostris extrusa TaxID=172846 RepID=A0AAV4X2E5_CAEEX|nr:hypothetical protein CEXT_774371 [Caerostris extrusa]
MKEVGDDVFAHPYLSGVFLASPGDAFALWGFPYHSAVTNSGKFYSNGLKMEKWKIPSQVPANHSPGRIAAQQEPKHSDD